jgi:hypothetical protein
MLNKQSSKSTEHLCSKRVQLLPLIGKDSATVNTTFSPGFQHVANLASQMPNPSHKDCLSVAHRRELSDS